MDRRQFLGVATALQAGWLTTGCATDSSVSTTVPSGKNPFQHGVASGDPLADRVILWTRVTPSAPVAMQVDWWIGERADGSDPLRTGTVRTTAERDYTVKVDAAGLPAGRRFYYGFSTEGFRSRIGRTRTAPSGSADKLLLAVTSCANLPNGYFNAYADIAAREDIDVVLSLGDYLYEYGEGTYGNGAELGRVPEPGHEIITLRDYRLRHAQHKAEQDLQDAHVAHPWVVVWDDHESANDSWSGGAQNHDDSEGDWSARRAAAIQAYYEWMPIREVPMGLHRNFRFGDLADLIMLDTRLEGRDQQTEPTNFTASKDPSRRLLGPTQEASFFSHLSEAQADGVRWKVVGQQVVFAPWTDDKTQFNPDSWDGYRASRSRVLNHLRNAEISDVVILTGDVHSSWGMEVPAEDGVGSQAVELVAPAVSSPPLATGSEQLRQLVETATQVREHVKFAEGDHNGYLTVDLTHERVRGEWRFTGPRKTRAAASKLGAALECASGSNRLA